MPTEHGVDGLPPSLAAEGESLGLPGMPGVPGGATGSFSPGGSSGGGQSKVSGQVLLAAAVLALAGGAIYGMRFYGLNAGKSGKEVKIDYTSQMGTPEAAKRFKTVMSELDASMNAVQLASTEDLPEAPFLRPKTAKPEPTAFTAPETEDDLDRLARMAAEQRRREQEERMALVQGELARLQVQGIIGGRVPAARINGQPVRVGQTLGVFTVSDISGQSVFVTADGNTYELQIGMPPRLVGD